MSGYVTDNITTPEGAQTQACTARGGTDFRERHSSIESMINTEIILCQDK